MRETLIQKSFGAKPLRRSMSFSAATSTLSSVPGLPVATASKSEHTQRLSGACSTPSTPTGPTLSIGSVPDSTRGGEATGTPRGPVNCVTPSLLTRTDEYTLRAAVEPKACRMVNVPGE